jgi:endosialidase-like protein
MTGNKNEWTQDFNAHRPGDEQMKRITKILYAGFAALAFASFALVQRADAVSPAPDGGYRGGNTAEGQNALLTLTTGDFNTAVGLLSLGRNATGSFNTALGAGALLATSGTQNAEGSENTATGAGALLNNTTGYENTATGAFALFSNTSSRGNTANGDRALFSNIGAFNTANGASALVSNTEGSSNTADGVLALSNNTTGSQNTAIGAHALSSTTGSYNIAIGYFAGISVTTASDVTCINHSGANVSDTTWMSNIYGVTTQSGTTAPVVVSDEGQLGTVASSQRFKKDIAAMENSSETILFLRPVTFHYKTDTKSIPQFGLIAEEVAKVNPALVLPDKEGKPYTVRYDAVNAMLLNEFLKEHRRVEQQAREIQKQRNTISELRRGMDSFVAQLKEQASQIQRVSAELKTSKAATKVVVNSP